MLGYLGYIMLGNAIIHFIAVRVALCIDLWSDVSSD